MVPAMMTRRTMRTLGLASALAFGACGSGASRTGDAGGAGGAGGTSGTSGDGGVTAASIGLTPCRDLSPNAISLTAAASSPHFLASGPLGASVIGTDGWRLARTFTGQLGQISAGVLAPDASWGATIGDDGALRIWRTSDGKETSRLMLAATPSALAASPAGDLLAVGDSTGTIVGVDPTTGASRWTATAAGGVVQSLHVTPDGRTVLAGTPSGFEWRTVTSGDLLRRFPAPAPADGGANVDAGAPTVFAPAAALSPDGSRFAYATGDAFEASTVKVVAAADGAPIGPGLTRQPRVSALAFSGDGTELVVGTTDGASVYDVTSGARVRTLASDDFPRAIAVSADGGIVAVAGLYLRFYRFSDGALLNTFGQTGFIWTGMFARDGRRLEFPGVGGPTQVWDAVEGSRIGLIERATTSGNQGAVIFSPTDQLFVAFNSSGTYWDIGQGTVAATVTFATSGGFDTIYNALFTPDGRTLVGTHDSTNPGELVFWDARTGAVLRTLSAHAGGLTALALSPDGTVLASAGYEQPLPDGEVIPLMNVIKLWDLASGALLVRLDGHTEIVNSIAFSPGGDLLVSGGREGLVRLWSLPDGRVVHDLANGRIPTGGATFNSFGNSVAFSPDGTRVAAAGTDWTITSGHSGVIALWSVADGSLAGRLLSLADANLGYITWSPAGNLLAAGSANGMRIWCLDDLSPPEP